MRFVKDNLTITVYKKNYKCESGTVSQYTHNLAALQYEETVNDIIEANRLTTGRLYAPVRKARVNGFFFNLDIKDNCGTF